MKCDENGGCPFRYEVWDSALGGMFKVPQCRLEHLSFGEGSDLGTCHLTSADFPIIRAEIAGEWSCETCANETCLRDGCPAAPCKAWQPKDTTDKGADDE